MINKEIQMEIPETNIGKGFTDSVVKPVDPFGDKIGEGRRITDGVVAPFPNGVVVPYPNGSTVNMGNNNYSAVHVSTKTKEERVMDHLVDIINGKLNDESCVDVIFDAIVSQIKFSIASGAGGNFVMNYPHGNPIYRRRLKEIIDNHLSFYNVQHNATMDTACFDDPVRRLSVFTLNIDRFDEYVKSKEGKK